MSCFQTLLKRRWHYKTSGAETTCVLISFLLVELYPVLGNDRLWPGVKTVVLAQDVGVFGRVLSKCSYCLAIATNLTKFRP